MAIESMLYKSSAVAEMDDRMATIDMGRKLGSCCAPFREGAGSHLTQCRLGTGLSPYQVASWSIQPFGHNTPTSQTGQDRQRSDIAQGEPFYKRSPKNGTKSLFRGTPLSLDVMSALTEKTCRTRTYQEMK